MLLSYSSSTTVSAKPTRSRSALGDHQLRQDLSRQGTFPPLSDVPSNLPHSILRSPPANLSLLRRAWDIGGEGWTTNVQFLQVFEPVQPAAQVLEEFYEVVLRQIEFTPGNTPKGKLCLTARGICMGFRCIGGRLPWELVRVAVRAMLEATKQGFAGEFRSDWQHPASGIIIQVGLVVIDVAVQRIMSGEGVAPVLPVACQLAT